MKLLSIRNLAVHLREITVLQDVNLNFRAGELTMIIGPNGAGKSTLLDCCAGIRKPTSGQISVGKKDLQSISPRLRAKALAYLPQHPEVAWDIDGETLVSLGRTPHRGAWGDSEADVFAVKNAMELTATSKFARRTVSSLSGGERARLHIARALAGSPSWFLADEPLADLDPGHALDTIALCRKLAHSDGLGVVLTVHDLSVALRHADRVIVLAQGTVLADGRPKEALCSTVLQKAYGIRTRVLQGDYGSVLEIIGRDA